MNYAIILAGGTGQRMRTSGMPKQFLDVYGKPIIVYTLEVFEHSDDIDEVIIPCNEAWIDHMKMLVKKYNLSKVKHVVCGGADRMGSINKGLAEIKHTEENDIVVIHDGVRPLLQQETIHNNVVLAKEKGNAMTVRPNVETVVVARDEVALWEDFKDRSITYTLTAPQSFQIKELRETLAMLEDLNANTDMPLLDVSLVYAKLGREIHLVKEEGNNLKITTPEDYYYLKSYLELQESKHILGV